MTSEREEYRKIVFAYQAKKTHTYIRKTYTKKQRKKAPTITIDVEHNKHNTNNNTTEKLKHI